MDVRQNWDEYHLVLKSNQPIKGELEFAQRVRIKHV